MGNLKYLIIHCTATPDGRDITSDQIRSWHMNPKPNGRGWDRVGYSDMIHLDGRLENLTPFNQDDEVDYNEMTWGAKGINGISRHVVYVGGVDENLHARDTRTPQQRLALDTYIRYTILRHPDILVAGHNQFSNKECPSFNVPEWLKLIGIPDRNIEKVAKW